MLDRITKAIRGGLRAQEGFTLAELLVVVAILAVLAAFTFPAVAGTKDTAKSGGDKTDKDSVAKSIERFQGDFQIDQAYIGAGDTPLGSAATANYTQATARYGLPLGCFIVATTGIGPTNTTVATGTGLTKQLVCDGSSTSAFPNHVTLVTAVYSDASPDYTKTDEVYMLDFQAKSRIRLKDGTYSLSQKSFVPDYLPKFPNSVAAGPQNSSGSAGDKFTGDADTRWVVRVKRGLTAGTESSSSETPVKVEIWKITGDATWALVRDK